MKKWVFAHLKDQDSKQTAQAREGAVAGLVGIECGVVSGVQLGYALPMQQGCPAFTREWSAAIRASDPSAAVRRRTSPLSAERCQFSSAPSVIVLMVTLASPSSLVCICAGFTPQRAVPDRRIYTHIASGERHDQVGAVVKDGRRVWISRLDIFGPHGEVCAVELKAKGGRLSEAQAAVKRHKRPAMAIRARATIASATRPLS
jgi:hypothetical protein